MWSKWNREFKQGLAIAISLAALVSVSLCSKAHAEGGGLITEIGGGVKMPSISSYLTNPDCKKAVVTQPEWPANPRAGLTYNCGGDNPLYQGYLLAWEFGNGVKFGWWHQSQWFDNDGEIHQNCLCASYTIRWGKRR
jgi:hypothetical protein